ncbi:MAG: hypothetical protein WC829_18075 [Hyphomicrobium sp.]|jgi:hypothetical protein
MGLKSIFDGLYVDQLIHKSDSGNFVVYPRGMMGPGYALPAARESTMRQRLRRLMLLSLVGGTSFAIFVLRAMQPEHALSSLGWALVSGLAVMLFGAIIYAQAQLTAGLERLPGPGPSVGARLRSARAARPTWTYWFSTVTGVIMIVAAVASVVLGLADKDMQTAASGVVLLCLGGLLATDGILGLAEGGRAR